MQSRRWGLIAVVALAMAGLFLGITLIGQKRHEAGMPATLTTTEEIDPTPFSSPSPPPTQTGPVTYTVKAGDTLSAIAQEHDVSVEALTTVNDLADPDVLQIGQILVIPNSTADAPPSPASTETPMLNTSADGEMIEAPPTMTPSGPPLVEIIEVTGVGNIGAEMLTMSNQGGAVTLEAWTLSGPAGDRFIFPALILFPEGKVRVHSAEGDDTPRDLYWDRTDPAWQEGELVTLRDANGNVVDTYIVPK